MWDKIRDNWTQIGAAVLLLLTLGAMRVEFGQLKADVQEMKSQNIPTMREKVERLDKMADDINAMKIDIAKQSVDLRYLRDAEQARQSHK